MCMAWFVRAAAALILVHVVMTVRLGVALTLKPECQSSCGGVDIPYPFGIGASCSRGGFNISCDDYGSAGTWPVLAGTSFRVVSISVDHAESQVMLPIGWQCYNASSPRTVSDYSYGTTTMNSDGVYRISNTNNMFVVVGCNTLGLTESKKPGTASYAYSYYTGCMTYCNSSASVQDGICAGIGCCHVDIPPGLTDNFFEFSKYDHTNMLEFSPCDYAFMVDKRNYTFAKSDLKMDVNRTSAVWLDWAIRDNGGPMTCAQAKTATTHEHACKSDHSTCHDSINGPGYFCNCSEGYEGNAYLVHGCTNINECERPKEYGCYGVCKDTPGFYECTCPRGYRSDNPFTKDCTEKFPRQASLAIAITGGVLVFVIIALIAVIRFQKRQLFRKNGGKTLKNVESLVFYTRGELKKITKNYTKFLGEGCFGKVYEGTLDDKDKTKVAVKTFIEVNKGNVDEFTHEVEIQSKMIHKNILRLKGCCLEVKRPMLVYEYAANGNLEDFIQSKEGCSLPLEQRLDIAIGSAQGLAYMHTQLGSNVIQHGDVKPGNILLDGHFIPKMSDFGLSKLLATENPYADVVKGSRNYMDPVYLRTGRLTAASDVYSFGAVLLEIISRKPPVSGDDTLIMEFQRLYKKEDSGCKLFDKDIATEQDTPVLEGIGRLAIQCLAEELKDRPDMTKVATRLTILKEEREHARTN